jgi:hypothetical protein
MLAAILLEGAGAFLLTRDSPRASHRKRRGTEALRVVFTASRWLVTMILVLGLLGLGIDVRPNPGAVARISRLRFR